ncbi:MAG: HigA family addiction module antidote protein [Anaerolineales bacterium]|nr:HigA family addiction module antidote protein [Anaerolineales bacterium]
MSKKKLAPVHPGEVLLEEYLKPLGLSQHQLALDISVDSRRINEIVRGKRSVTADTALRLARYFETSPEFWLRLQSQYNLDCEKDKLGSRLDREVQVYSKAH